MSKPKATILPDTCLLETQELIPVLRATYESLLIMRFLVLFFKGDFF